METLLEQGRRLHEERERLTQSMTRQMLKNKQSHKEQINAEHRMKMLLDRYLEATTQLHEIYEDRDCSRRSEMTAMGGQRGFEEFYSRLRTIKEFHKRAPNEFSVPMSVEFDTLNRQIDEPSEHTPLHVDFTDEEGYGRFMDLHHCFELFVNLRGLPGPRLDYITYLAVFDRLFDFPLEHKQQGDYKRYLQKLLEYLCGFVERVRPLLALDDELAETQAQFESKWRDGSFPGWEQQQQVPAVAASVLASTGAQLDLSNFSSAEQLQGLGLGRLKTALQALGLKCGGTLQERAERLWATKGKSREQWDQDLFPKGVQAQQLVSADAAITPSSGDKRKDIAAIEAQVYRLLEILSEERANTKEQAERRQARGGLIEEEEEEIPPQQQLEEDERDEDIPYNPKNLPLDWDGKPIPYWLYKLHGLNISYPCEICGNMVYKGPKAFQRHFSEWRHAHGMRCLGIPNTAHFANVTRIGDALELWQRLSVAKEHERFRPEMDEEFEDSLGNVVSRRIYDDLKRQGVL